MSEEPDWRATNRANWDERVGVHLNAPDFYDLAPLRAGQGRLNAIEEAELGPVAGLRVLHLQCHFGADTLNLAQRGAEVIGVDFSPEAIAAANRLRVELGLAERVRFKRSDVYDAPSALPGEEGAFDLVYVTWGALCWLPDIVEWALIVAHFLRPGGRLYLADAHPAALVFDDAAPKDGEQPGWFAPYFQRAPLVLDDERDYADPDARLKNKRTYSWMHPLGAIVTALLSAELTLDYLHEHPRIPWPMFAQLVRDADGLHTWPDKPWLPLAFSLQARRR